MGWCSESQALERQGASKEIRVCARSEQEASKKCLWRFSRALRDSEIAKKHSKVKGHQGGGVVSETRIVDRDLQIFREIDRWRVVLGRHIAELVGFTGIRACDQRLSKLISAGYIERRKILYGIPSIYSLTSKAKILASLPARTEKIRVEQIPHDIAVLDTAIYFHKLKEVPYGDMTTEKQLHSLDGFGTRKHRPDLIINRNGKSYCIEVELSLKAKSRLEAIIQDNFMQFDHQIWIVPDKSCKIYQILADNQAQFTSIHILELQEVQKND